MARLQTIAALSALLAFSLVPGARAQSPGASDADYYTVQVMTLPASHKANAEALADRLRRRGYAAYLITSQDRAGNVLHKVRFGKYATSKDALRAAAAFEQEEQLSTLVLRSSFDIPIPLC